MPDRTEIDALLIGALYGELTPADEARLTAHLDSHPADRTALSDLTRTRAAVRESRLLAFQFEPRQSISALLLREASRRAPRPAPATEGWFQRFMRSFMAHPAMAAAAMLVLVVGVAGTLYLRGGDHFASPKLEAASPTASPVTGAPGEMRGRVELPAPSTIATTTPAAVPPAEPPAPPSNAGGPVAAGAGSASVGAAGSETAEGYRVGLEEKQAARNDLALEASRPAPRPASPTKAKRATKADSFGDDLDQISSAKLAKKPSGIEIHSPQPQPKELKDGDVGLKKSEAASGGAAGPSPAAQPVQAPARPSSQAALNEPPAPAPTAPSGASSDGTRAPSKPVTRGAAHGAAPSPPPPPPAATAAPSSDAAANTRDGRAADKASDAGGKDNALLSWARKQHEQVISLVGSSDCRAAASAAAEIYNRAPTYYAANVVTDRQVRPCLAYLNSERDRQDRVRASKRAIRTDDAARTDERK